MKNMTEGDFLEAEIKIEEEEVTAAERKCSSFQTTRKKSRKNKFPCKADPGKLQCINKSWREYLKLENKLQTYYCNHCAFETKWKCYLKSHIKNIHSSEEVYYCCVHCNFRTKWKFSLQNHMKVHCSPDSLKMYKCPKCEYQTKWNNGLTSHMKVHMLPKIMKVTIYKCADCSFECKNKLDLAQHKNIQHSNMLYKCPLCSFQTKFRHGVNKHVKVHNGAK